MSASKNSSQSQPGERGVNDTGPREASWAGPDSVPAVVLPSPVQHWTVPAPGPINTQAETPVQPDENNNNIDGRAAGGGGETERREVRHVFSHSGPGSHTISYYVDNTVEENTAHTNIVGGYQQFFMGANLREHFQGTVVRNHHVITFRNIEMIETTPDIIEEGMVKYDEIEDSAGPVERKLDDYQYLT